MSKRAAFQKILTLLCLQAAGGLLMGCVPKVTMTPPSDAMFVGSYTRMPVTFEYASYENVEFQVVEGEAGGYVSTSKDDTYDSISPHVMLVAGYKPGTYNIQAVHKTTGSIIGQGTFDVSVKSQGTDKGPSLVTAGMLENMYVASAWGGGPSGPQNMNTNPATGTRRVAVILVDTSDERFPTDATAVTAIKKTWMDNIVDGHTIGATQHSMARYFREVSLYQAGVRGMDVSAQIFGPYNLNGTWDEVGGGADFWDHTQAAVTAADSDINYNNFDSILVVTQSVGAVGAADAEYVWPQASVGEWNGWVTAEGNVMMGAIRMPVDWKARDGREIFATASHELGHNLGMGDTYTPSVPGRNPGSWDLMSNETHRPAFNTAYRMRLGWVEQSWIKTFDFASAGTSVDETVSLVPMADGAPGANKFVAVEVRVSDGYNYYFSYRSDNPGVIFDSNLPENDRVLGIDVISTSVTPPYARPGALLLPGDAALGEGEKYSETDHSTPIYPVEFTATASGLTGSQANLRIQYGINDKPDPSIRPWPAPPYQSPDIEVVNARNQADPTWKNVPWAGNPNTVIARVKNSGALNAPQVQVDFYVKDFNTGTPSGTPPPQFFLGSAKKDIPAGSTVEFTTSWTPPAAGHFCIVARIPLYTTPGTPSVVEMTELNNLAQSNYDRFISDTASPARRQITEVEVENPFDKRTRIYLNVANTNPYYRTYIQHKWLDLDPGKTEKIPVMFEYVGAAPETGQDISKEWSRKENMVHITGLVANPHDERKHAFPVGGVSVSVATGRSSKFTEFVVTDGQARGCVATSDGSPIVQGFIILSIITQEGDTASVENQTQALEQDDCFSMKIRHKGQKVQGYYLPAPGYAEAYSEIVPYM